MTTVNDLIKFLEAYKGWELRCISPIGSLGLEFIPRMDIGALVIAPVGQKQAFLVKADHVG